jgi:peroxiredoxin
MAVTSTMVPLGTVAPPLSLPDPDGQVVSLDDHTGVPVLVVFACNHCPYVVHVADALGRTAATLHDLGVVTLAVMSNDWSTHPADAPAHMGAFAVEHGWGFPYLVDEDQAVAAAYGAACTPDFFLFDAEHRLAYRGQMDGARPSNDAPNDGADLLAAARAVIDGTTVSNDQRPSMGCSIKWRQGSGPS